MIWRLFRTSAAESRRYPSFQLGMKQLGEATALPSTLRQVDDSGSILAWQIQTDQYQFG